MRKEQQRYTEDVLGRGRRDVGESRRTDGEIEPWLEEVMCGGDGWGK
jgi:hypothetical protein